MTNELTLENIRSGAFPSDAVAVGFLLGEIKRLTGQLNFANREPPHCPSCNCGSSEPCEQRSEVNSIDDVAAICHSVTGLCCHILGSPGGPCTIGNCAAVRGYLGGPEFAQGASRDASSPCPSVHDHMWRPAQHGEYCIRCNATRTGE
jgi:hypothetical protein